MGVIIMDGNVRVYWLTALPANLSAPTTTELNAGTDITTYITPDGLDVSWSTGRVDVGNVGSTFGLERVGRRKPTVALTCHHDSTTGSTDPAWSIFAYRTLGVLAIRRGIAKATAWTSGQGAGGTTGTLEIFPVESGQDSPVKPAPDTSFDFTTDLTVYLDPAPRAIVA